MHLGPRWYTDSGASPGLIDMLRASPERRRIRQMCLAIPGQVVELVDEVNQIAKVDVVGVRRNINVSLLANDGDEARPGDWVLIHVGFALSKVDEEEAHATLALLQRMGRDYEQELEELKASVIE
jgi:hydrogenase expression/formation protein HypC